MAPAPHRPAAGPLRPWSRLLRAALVLLLWLAAPQSSALALPLAPATVVHWAEREPSGEFARAVGPRPWHFPADLGPHPDFQTEWWYTTGNLETPEGRGFGYQFTVFRQALEPEPTAAAAAPDRASTTPGTPAGGSRRSAPVPPPSPPSPWRTNQVYWAHFSISDLEAGRFRHEERYSRGSLGLAGARGEPYAVWLNDWRVEAEPDDPGQLRLIARTEAMAIDLKLRASRPPVLQGERGLSRKGPDPGNASYYYSQIQQPSEGTIRLGEERWPVRGVSWTDHEFFTRSLGQGTVGWDWFSAQFDDGSALMLFGLRGEGGTSGPGGAGRWIDGDREIELAPEDIHLEVVDHWRSPRNGALYPAGWRIEVPRLDLVLQAHPLLADQELTTAADTYWEGALGYAGQRGGKALHGRGYGELTGYAGPINDSLAANRSRT